ncbi:hypothetical protein [Allomesorhizobium alhagi]|uniref:Uncharacterized protein n=1 Tax=Mesorhizobium alhagi CCNWXJ12-2 TaxID=1107882 RepID=H0HYR0_9HYPH|nr:hypothetical protein [Mesorhizobium alhagi]EHK54132.1 hypothetical protein MAXJ12_26723 [Mesorhizobium alhagi CCNWXJ12-2]
MSEVAGMLQFHCEGLQRICKVIDANSDYDDLMAHRITEDDKALFGEDVDLSDKIKRATSLFDSKFRSRTYKIILPEFSGFACDGSTENNLREFLFFERICSPAGITIGSRNYAKSTKISISDLSPSQMKAMESIIADVDTFYRYRSTITASLVHQQIIYSCTFFSFLISFSRDGAVKPTALVLANDHSPSRVALSMIMKGLNVPRVYLQHAEVTSGFPPLDFEYCVLRNKKSLDTYKTIGPIAGRVFVITRYTEPFTRELLVRPRGQKVTVVIYPTSRIIVEMLKQLLIELRSNSGVEKIIIKEHPGAAKQLRNQFEGVGVEFTCAIPEDDHIAIVGNSSVAIELLHRGIPVYQNFDFDPVCPDYYGFVRGGLTFEVDLTQLSSAFWRPYHADARWLSTFVQWDASANDAYLTDQAQFVKEMTSLAEKSRTATTTRVRPSMKGRFRARLKGVVKRGAIRLINANRKRSSRAANFVLSRASRAANFLSINADRLGRFLLANTEVEISAPIWRTPKQTANKSRASKKVIHKDEIRLFELLEYTLRQVPRPAEWLLMNEQANVFNPAAVIATLEKMFQERNNVLNIVFDGFRKWPSGSVVGTWVYLKRAEWGNFVVDPAELEAISTFVFGYEGDGHTRALLENSLLTTILRSGTCDQLDSFWLNASVVKKDKLSINRKIQVLRKLRCTPGREAEAEHTLEDFERQASTFELLKLRNTEFLEGRVVEGWHHQHVEHQFSQVAPRNLAQEFEAHLRPVYDALRPRMELMNVRAYPSEAKHFWQMAQRALNERAPLSMIRLSDGEGYLFPDRNHFHQEDIANRERHWWGTELPTDLRSEIIREARQAIAEADVVGIPAIYRFIRDHSESSRSLGQSLQGRGLLEVLSGVGKIVSPSALITEDKVNVALFSDPATLLPLIESARKVTILSSVVPATLPSIFHNARRLETITIPTHYKTMLNESYSRSPQALPFLYRSILDKVDQIVMPGDLVLVAGGIIGKIFIGRARAKGAVALDLGHVVDDWIHPALPSIR